MFLLWGGKSVGKTGALKLKAAEWEKRGHPVIEVDLKGSEGKFYGGFDGTLFSFAQLLSEATRAAFERHKQNIPYALQRKLLKDTQEQETVAPLTPTLAIINQVKQAVKKVPDTITYIVGVLSGVPPELMSMASQVGSIFASLKNTTPTRRPLTEADFVAVFQMLEELAKLRRNRRTIWDKLLRRPGKPLLPPIVMIREVQRLDSVSDDPELGRRVFAKLFNYFEPRKQGDSRVPAILETSDFLWSRLKQILSSQESFIAFQMKFWDKADAEEWLVKHTLEGQLGPIYTQAEFDKVWNYLCARY